MRTSPQVFSFPARPARWATGFGERWLRRILALAAAALVLFVALTAWYFRPVTTTYRVSTSQGGPSVRLALVTDLHSCRYGKDEWDLVRRLEAIHPDALFLGGDIFDDVLPDGNTLAFLDAVSARWPCFYVTGNHEFWSGRHAEMKEAVRARGIAVLDGGGVPFECRGRTIMICGIDDPTYMEPGERHPPKPDALPADDPTCRIGGEWRRQLAAAQASVIPGCTAILLSHRPERAENYRDKGFDLVLSGHTHGGQVALPFGLLDGLYAPSQGLFPKYAAGTYDIGGGTTLVVSRGLARESTPLPRWFNHPEIVAIDLD